MYNQSDGNGFDFKKNNLTISVETKDTHNSNVRFHILIDLFSGLKVVGQIKLHVQETPKGFKRKVTWIKWSGSSPEFCSQELKIKVDLLKNGTNAAITMLEKNNTFEVSFGGMIVNASCSPKFKDPGEMMALISVIRLDKINEELEQSLNFTYQLNPKRESITITCL